MTMTSPHLDAGAQRPGPHGAHPVHGGDGVDDAGSGQPPEWLQLVGQSLRNSGLLVSLVIVSVYFSLEAPYFLTLSNLWVMLRTVAPVGIISVGMTLVIIAGEIDLGVGSLGGFSGVLVAWLAISHGWPLPLAIACTLFVGVAAGSIAGILRVAYDVPTFVSTLAYLVSFQGLGFLTSNGFPISPFPDSFSELGAGTVHGAPVSGLVMLAIFAVGWFMTRFSQFGRWLFAVGGNVEAARLVGINVNAVKIAVMAITGLLAAFAGIVVSSLLSAGDPNVGTSWVFDVVAAVIIGGTNLNGGRGSVARTLVGVLFIGTLVDGMVLMNVSQYAQDVVRGAIILFAVLLSLIQTRRRRARLNTQ
jgi:ribose/xylose/arabinose/galactoside ABC-type transport system permease subunit